MQVNKTKDSFGYNVIELIENEITFTIFYGGNGDLYWKILDNNDLIKDKDATYTPFIITKENMFIYNLFEDLFKRIQEKKPFKENDILFNEFKYDTYSYNELFDGNIITWISDDRDLDYDNLVKISKKEDTFLLEFSKYKKNDNEHYLSDFNPYVIHIRFRNSGSHYDPYNCTFMDMYNAFENYEPDHHQIHIEEHLYSLK